jgi:hypothetical protein
MKERVASSSLGRGTFFGGLIFLELLMMNFQLYITFGLRLHEYIPEF